MHYCLADYLTVITPYLSRELVSVEALSRIRAIAQKLQPSWGALLECNLGSDTSQVDFSIDLLGTAIELDEGIQASSVWQRIQQLYLSCVNPTSIDRETESIWLEFELAREQQEISIPNVFLSLKEECIQHLSDNPAAFCWWLIEKAIEPLLGRTIPVQLQQNLQLCLEALPLGAQVLHVGVMLSYQTSIIRLKVNGISRLELSEYLTKIGWDSSAEEFDAIALNLYSLVDRIILNVEISVTAVTRVGLECFVDRYLPQSSQWQPLLNYLVTSNLCTPEKSSALLAWSGLCYEQFYPLPWPRNLKTVSNFLGTRAFSVLVREINHIELILQPENTWSAKGYLWFSSDWLKSKKLKNYSN